ncbi:MAG: hypothetical protein J1E00_03335 [Oscillospiraceae bacterium]|nr:hypothetical protein [Oscillospiraceae bacterium]
MKTPRIANAVGHLDDDLVSGAAGGKKKTKRSLLKWGSLAACLAVVLTAGVILLPKIFRGTTEDPSGPAGKTRKNVTVSELAILWPWEHRTVYEKYVRMEIDGEVYCGQMREISASLLLDYLGDFEAVGYEETDAQEPKEHREAFAVYAIAGVPGGDYVAAEMEGRYYVFRRDTYAPPANLGELFASVDLPEVLELLRFSKNGDGADAQHFQMTDDGIWALLSGCSDAKFVGSDQWTDAGRERITFSITSDALGIYKRAFTITADGYLSTNAFEWGYVFAIGEEAAGKILTYAAEHSVEAKYEPFTRSVAGKVTEITEKYLILDDSVLWEDPADGSTYKVSLEDPRIRRYVAYGVIHVGDLIAVDYEGWIEASSNLVHGARSLSQATIADGDVLIPE